MIKDDTKNKTEEKKEEKHEEEKDIHLERIEQLENQLKRALADYQNLEKRQSDERREWIRSANKELILKLLGVLDILMLANQHLENEGLTLSIKQFLDTLKTEGVEKIETEGKMFDPNTMECIQTDPSASSGQDGKVIKEVRSGYTIFDKILRPAQVTVGKKGEIK